MKSTPVLLGHLERLKSRRTYLVLQSSSPTDLHTEGKKWKLLSKFVAFL